MLRKTFSRGSKSLSSVSRQYNSRSGFHFVSNDKVIYGIVGINTAVFCGWHLAQQDRRLSQFMRNNFLLSYYGVWKNLKFHTLVTSMFSHQDFWHLAGNMVTLYFFGSGAIAVLGARQFLSLYMGAGVFSSLCTASWPDLIPKSWPAAWQRSRYTPALGASGAVAGVVTWSIFSNPGSIIMLYMIIPVPAALFGVLYIANEVSGLYSGGTGKANVAHLGGVAFGGLYYFKSTLRRFLRL